jgi:hypothetical protein
VQASTQIITETKLSIPALVLNNLGVIVDAIVAIYNAFGPFTKSAPKV